MVTALKSKFKKEKLPEKFVLQCLFAKKLPINLALASGIGNKIFQENHSFQRNITI
jgi:hypothetical protein